MTTPQPPAAPAHLLRTHSSSISTIFVSLDNKRIYSGDASGLVVVTSTRSLRTITKWNPHTDSLLGIEEWGNHVITHARDNKLHVWTRVEELSPSARVGSVAQTVGEHTLPHLCYSMDVNALNYCRFSLLPDSSIEAQALVALPNLVDSTSADVWTLPSCARIHAAVGQMGKVSLFNSNPMERSKTGIIMSLHIFKAQDEPSSSTSGCELRLLCAYESGSVVLRRYTRADKATSVEGAGWEIIWDVKLHAETIMAMRVSRNNSFALTVSADHLVGRYDLASNDVNTACVLHRTKYPGNAAITIHDNERVCAVAGWDGSLRLYSARTMKPLGTLKYHKTSCQAAEFARSLDTVTRGRVDQEVNDDIDDDEEMDESDKEERARWLVAGGRDNRVSIWTLMDFVK